MKVTRLREGLWIWSLPHPAWEPKDDRPDGWPQVVNCLYFEAPGANPGAPAPIAALVLIDPLVPAPGTSEAEKFFAALDRDVERARARVEILVGNEFHGRSANALRNRYAISAGADVWAHESYPDKPECLPTRHFRDGETLPGGVVARNAPALSRAETLFWIPAHSTLYAADSLVGIGTGGAGGPGALRVVPPSWAEKDDASQARFRCEMRPSLRRLLDLPIEMIVPAHGDPILVGGRAALEAALAAPDLGAA